MVLMARKFLLFIIIAAVIHITGLICQYYFRISNDVREQNIQKIPSKHQLHKSKSNKVISLTDLVVCNSNVIEELHKQATTVHEIQENVLMCPHVAPDLGPVENDAAIMNLRGIEDMMLKISAGGIHVPDCVAQQQVAIVLAVNDNIWKSIGKFIFYIHPFLMKQQLEYQIFVVRKIGSPGGAFERGKLFNIGFIEAQNYLTGGWDCFIFHDVNLLPLDTRNLYRCSRRPKKLIADFRKPYRFGGAVAISPQHFVQVDGFSNRVWSNDDGDYIDMYKRIMAANLTIESNFKHFGTYTTFDIAYYNHTTKSVTNAVRSSQRGGRTQYDNRIQRRNMLQRNQTHSSSNLKDGISSLFYSNSRTLKMEQFYSVIEIQDDDEQI